MSHPTAKGPILRIVRMEFTEDTLTAFEQLFDTYKSQIRRRPGCRSLQLHRDADHPWVRYTYSVWDNASDLESYRQSELFAEVWPATKQLFGGKPRAYSLKLLEQID